MTKEKIIVPLDKGNATVAWEEDDLMKITITSNGVKYEFEATPAGIESYSIDGGIKRNYTKVSERL